MLIALNYLLNQLTFFIMINQEVLRNRTKHFAIEIILFLKKMPVPYEDRIVTRQLLRSSTSVAANYRAACRSRSDADFYSKICIVLEEADETLFWLEIITETGIINSEKMQQLLEKATEFVKIFSTMRKSLKDKDS